MKVYILFCTDYTDTGQSVRLLIVLHAGKPLDTHGVCILVGLQIYVFINPMRTPVSSGDMKYQ